MVGLPETWPATVDGGVDVEVDLIDGADFGEE